MKTLAPLLAMLREWITSKKVLTAILTAVAGVLIRDHELRDRVMAVGVVLLGAQGANDAGKGKAEVEAASAEASKL